MFILTEVVDALYNMIIDVTLQSIEVEISGVDNQNKILRAFRIGIAEKTIKV